MPIQTHIRDNAATTALIRKLMNMQEETRLLNKEEERALISKYRKNPDELRKQLVMHNIRLVFNVCKKYALSARSFDDIVGKAMVGLCYAATKFDIDKGIKFSTYATNWIFKAAYEYDWETRVEKKDPMNVSTSIDQLISDLSHSSKADGTGATMENFITDSIDPNFGPKTLSVDEQVANDEQYEVYGKLLQYLKTDPVFLPIDSDILERRFVEKQTYRQISADLDIPVREVKNRETMVLKKFKEYLASKMNIGSYSDIANTETFSAY